MNAVRIRRRIDYETLHVPELRPMIGKDVEIIVLEEHPRGAPSADISKLRELAGNIDLDSEAIEKLREISKI